MTDTVLCLFSGGIDSAGVLHKMFTDSEFANRPLVVHHVYLNNRENRARAELTAVEQILSYYRRRFAGREFTYTSSIFDTTGFAPLRAKRYPFDVDVLAFMAGNICVARKDIRQVATGRTRTDLNEGGEPLRRRIDRGQSILKSVFLYEEEEAPEYIQPVIEMSKYEIWSSLPREVRDAVWYCRSPKYTDQGIPNLCGHCLTCRQVEEFLQKAPD